MIKCIKQMLISADALLLMVYVYAFKQIVSNAIYYNSIISVIGSFIKFNCANVIFFVLAILSFGLILLFSYLLLQFCMLDSSDVVNKIINLQEVTNEYMPIYLGYIFVAMSINNNKTFVLVFLILLIILFKTQVVAFNPMFCLLGYHYYRIKTSDKPQCIDIFVMSKKENIKDYKELRFQNLSKINEFTYIDKEV